MFTMLDHLITADGEEENRHHKNIRKMIEELICTRGDAEYTQGEINKRYKISTERRHEITSDIFLRTFNKFPRLVTAIYNQCLKRGISEEYGRQQISFQWQNPAKELVRNHPNTVQQD